MSSLANSEEIIEGDSVDSSIQQVVGSGGQRVITIVTDGVPLGNIQTAVPAGSIGQPFIVTVQDGQQGELSHLGKCVLKDILHTPHSSENEALKQVVGLAECQMGQRCSKIEKETEIRLGKPGFPNIYKTCE